MASPTIVLVDTTALLDLCISDISSTIGTQPSKLAIDLEGVDLCRHGSVSIVQIFADTSNVIWLVDVTTLGRVAFDHKDAYGQSLREVFQNPITKKVLPVPNFNILMALFAQTLTYNYPASVRCAQRCRCSLEHLSDRVSQRL